MSSANFPLRQVGIYRNLPTFDPALSKLKAIVCGASGISGFNTLRALLSSPERWEKIYTLSRSPLSEDALKLLPPHAKSQIQHVPVDFTTSAKTIAQSLIQAGVSAKYIFFYAYLPGKTKDGDMHPNSARALVEANVPLLDNFLQSLPLAQIQPKRILLQTGGKNWGMHIGRVRTPLVESDPQPRHLLDNFYYGQEDVLFKYCEDHPETSWNIVRPTGIIGASPSLGMNMMYSFAVYAAVQARKGQPLQFGGDFDSWQFEAAHSSAILSGFLSEWAVLEEKCANQDFNALDGSHLSWDRFFHELARWYGVEAAVIPPKDDDGEYKQLNMAGGKESPLGYGPPLSVRKSFELSEWAQDESNKQAWNDIMNASKGQLKENPFDGREQNLMTGDFAYLHFGILSQNKVRRFGFNGFVDTLESIFEQFRDMEVLGFLPAMVVNAANPMI